MLLALQRGPRPDLLLGVMSATLPGERLAGFLGADGPAPGPAPVIESTGRMYEVDLRSLPAPPERPLPQEVRGALHRLLRDEAEAGTADPGDILVFLPGGAEIRRTA